MSDSTALRPLFSSLPPRLKLKMAYSFNAEDADLVLRSSDHKEFRVHKCILSIASSVFRDMFSLPQPHYSDKLPSVDLPETTETLDILLRYIYPIPSPKIEDFVTLSNILASAEKYAADGVISRLRDILVSPFFLNLNPLRVYVIACRWDMHEEAKIASMSAVYGDLVELGEDCMEDMKYISGLDHHRLLVLQQARRAMIQKAVTEETIPGSCCSLAYTDIKKLLMEEMLRRKLGVSDFLSVLERSGKAFKPCKSAGCSLGHAKVEAFVKGVVTGLGELPSSI